MVNISDLVTRIRKGEKVSCIKCGKGIYVTTEGYLETSHCYWCDKCGDTIHITPGNVIVE